MQEKDSSSQNDNWKKFALQIFQKRGCGYVLSHGLFFYTTKSLYLSYRVEKVFCTGISKTYTDIHSKICIQFENLH